MKLSINLETLIANITYMKARKFVACVNKYARDTRYNVLEDDVVCYIDKNDTKTIRIIDPEYFGIYSNKMRVDHLKKCYSKNLIDNWANIEREDQELVFLAFC